MLQERSKQNSSSILQRACVSSNFEWSLKCGVRILLKRRHQKPRRNVPPRELFPFRKVSFSTSYLHENTEHSRHAWLHQRASTIDSSMHIRPSLIGSTLRWWRGSRTQYNDWRLFGCSLASTGGRDIDFLSNYQSYGGRAGQKDYSIRPIIEGIQITYLITTAHLRGPSKSALICVCIFSMASRKT